MDPLELELMMRQLENMGISMQNLGSNRAKPAPTTSPAPKKPTGSVGSIGSGNIMDRLHSSTRMPKWDTGSVARPSPIASPSEKMAMESMPKLPAAPSQSPAPRDMSDMDNFMNKPGPPMPRVSSQELPFETFQRLTGMGWGEGKKSGELARMMEMLGITSKPGSAEANLALQKALMANSKNIG